MSDDLKLALACKMFAINPVTIFQEHEKAKLIYFYDLVVSNEGKSSSFYKSAIGDFSKDMEKLSTNSFTD